MQWPTDLAEDKERTESTGQGGRSRQHSRRDSSPIHSSPRLTRAPSSSNDPSWQNYWTSFVQDFGSDLRKFARAMFRRHGARANADDLAEDAFNSFLVSCMERGWLSREDAVRHPKAFLRAIFAAHICDTHRRLRTVKRGGRFHRADSELGRLALPESTPTDGDDASSWLVPALNGAIHQLERRNRGYAALLRHLLDLGGRSRSELAARVGLKPDALAQRLHRARRAFLREVLKAVGSVTPDLETAQARCRWLVREVLSRRSAGALGLR